MRFSIGKGDVVSAHPMTDRKNQNISVDDNLSKKAMTQRDLNLSEKPVIPPETTTKNDDILDMLMKTNHINDHRLR